MLSMLSTEQTKRRSGEMRWWGEVHISQLRIRTPVASYYTGHGPAVTGIFSACFDKDFPCDTYMHEIHLFCSEPMRLFTVVFLNLYSWMQSAMHGCMYVRSVVWRVTRDYYMVSWWIKVSMMTSSNGKIFRVTDHLCGEFTGHRWIPRTKASDAELWCFLWSAPE